jgi:MFS family permease
MGAINSYPQYRSYFGFPLDEGTPSTGIVYAIYTIGNLVGSFAAGPATDFRGKRQQSKQPSRLLINLSLGRRVGMFIGGLIIIIGTCVQASSHDLAAFMVGRFILGFGVAISASAGPAYVSEMAHPSFRGVMTGM